MERGQQRSNFSTTLVWTLVGSCIRLVIHESYLAAVGDMQMLYKKINIELIVPVDEAEAVVAELNASLDRLDDKHTLFGGQIETVTFEHRRTQKRSALAHTIAASESVVSALQTAQKSVAVALRAVI